MKTFYGELALTTENAFQNILILLPSMPLFSSALGLLEFLVEEGECQWPLEMKPVQISIPRFQGPGNHRPTSPPTPPPPKASCSGLFHQPVGRLEMSEKPVQIEAGMVPQLLGGQKDYQGRREGLHCKQLTTQDGSLGCQQLGIVFIQGPAEVGGCRG